MNQHTLDVLEYDKVRELLVSFAASGLGKNLAQRVRPLTDVHRIERLIETVNPDKIVPVHTQQLGWFEERWPERVMRAEYGCLLHLV